MALENQEQVIQEDQYSFPYHYIPSHQDGNFRLYAYWSWGINYLLSTDFLLERLSQMRYEKLIDIGCGDGRFLNELKRVDAAKQLLGIDYSERAIKLAQAFNPEIDFRQLDIFNCDLADDFDVVTLIEVLEHIPLDRVPGFLEAIAQRQRSGDRLLITVPHSNRKPQKKHFQHFNNATLAEQLSNTYEVSEYVYFDRNPRHARYIRGLMKNRFFILRQQRLLNRIYRYYKERLFYCSEAECTRMFALCIRK
jgi:2-polyprenyl-3-methyl-5-hydroxy-6-metoxy-1,4-benzoquinol methylase